VDKFEKISNGKVTLIVIGCIRKQFKRKKIMAKDKLYYRLFCTQNHVLMATGYNSFGLKELKDAYISYKSIDFERGDKTRFLKMTQSKIVSYIEDDCFNIESSKTPFSEEEDPMNNF
jgi:hypothetical protein